MYKLIGRVIYDEEMNIVGVIREAYNGNIRIFYGDTDFGTTFSMESVSGAYDESLILLNNPEKYAESKESLRIQGISV